jgi:hypothetical protein
LCGIIPSPKVRFSNLQQASALLDYDLFNLNTTHGCHVVLPSCLPALTAESKLDRLHFLSYAAYMQIRLAFFGVLEPGLYALLPFAAAKKPGLGYREVIKFEGFASVSDRISNQAPVTVQSLYAGHNTDTDINSNDCQGPVCY